MTDFQVTNEVLITIKDKIEKMNKNNQIEVLKILKTNQVFRSRQLQIYHP